MKKLWFFLILAVTLLLGISSTALAIPVLMTEDPWGPQANDRTNMNAVFGQGNYDVYTSYAAAPVDKIFIKSNQFVMMEGGAGTDLDWYKYLDANKDIILKWVDTGGRLLLMSAGWTQGVYQFGPAALVQDGKYSLSSSGKLTEDGFKAFTFQKIDPYQTGTYLAHDYVKGEGLTVFMNGSGEANAGYDSFPDSTSPGNGSGPIVAGINYGKGYIMYAGLTDSVFHRNGPGLVNDVIAYTANAPIPGALYLFGSGLIGLAGLSRRKLRKR